MGRMVPLRCFCGNAVIRPRLEHEAGAREVVTSLCPACDEGGRFEETFYTDERGRLLPYPLWMEHRGLDPAKATGSAQP